MPHDKQKRDNVDYRQNLVTTLTGAQRQDGLTDRQSQSDFVSPHHSCSKPLAGNSSAETHRQKNSAEQAADKCTDGDMVTLITTVQQIMTSLQTAVCGLVM
jgi:hypothetical protein